MTLKLTDTTQDTAPDPRLWLGVIVPTAGIIMASAVLIISWSQDLPSEIAQQWDWNTRQVNTVGSLWSNVLLMLGMAAAMLIVLAVMKWSGKLTSWGRRLTTGSLAGIVFFLAGSAPVMLSNQRGITDPLLAPDPRTGMMILGLASLTYGVLSALVVGGRPLHADTAPGDATAPMDLGPSEVAVWNQQVTAWIFLLTGGISGIALLVAAMMTPLWFLAPLGGVLLLLGIVCGRWNVTVDHRGLTCTTRFGLGRFNMPATAQTIADVTEVRGISEFLGWGLRIGSAGSVALILHNGKTLRIQDPQGRSLTVTVKDPATPAALFNAQAERHKQITSG